MYPPPARGGFAEHVIQRGTSRAACFRGVPDRHLYLALLARLALAFEFRVHAYALMGNHIHLLLTGSRMAGAAELMDAVRTEFGCGVLGVEQASELTAASTRLILEEGCAASPIHTARHLLACMRYIELNPVRAGLVRRPEDFPWSSYAANAGRRVDALLSPHPHYLALGRDPGQRRAAYRRSVEAILSRDRSSGL